MIGVAFGVIFAALMGLASIFSRRGLEHESFEVMLVTSLGVATPPFALLAYVTTGFTDVPLDAALLVAASGVVGSVVGRTFYILSIQVVGPGKALSIVGTSPLVGAFLAVVFLGEHVTPLVVLGTVVVVGGVVGIARDASVELSAGDYSRFALAFPFTAAVFLASAVIIRKRSLTMGLAPIEAGTINMGVGFVAALPLLLYRRGTRPDLDPTALKNFVVASLIMATAFVFYFVGLRITPAHVFFPLVQTQPMFAVVFSTLLLGELEIITRRTVVGVVLLVTGVVLVVLGSPP